MTVRGFAINLSNLIWTCETERACWKRSVLVMQDLRHPEKPDISGEHKRFWIYCGTQAIEQGYVRYAAYLAVVTREGKYRLEWLEKYLEERNGQIVLDVLHLPEEMNGLRFQKMENYQNAPWEKDFNRPAENVAFCAEKGDPLLWTIEGWNTVTFVIGASATGKSHFIAEQFQGRGYVVLDVLDYQKRVDTEEDTAHCPVGDWLFYEKEKLFRVNERLKNDMLELVRQGKDVVVEQTFFRALRRIGYVEALREVSPKIQIEIYVLMPSEERLRKNCETRWGDNHWRSEYELEKSKHDMAEVLEFPDPAEGFSLIYTVSDNGITLRMDEPDWTLPKRAKAELQKESEERTKAKEKSERLERLWKQAARIWNSPEGMLLSDDTKTGQ